MNDYINDFLDYLVVEKDYQIILKIVIDLIC